MKAKCLYRTTSLLLFIAGVATSGAEPAKQPDQALSEAEFWAAIGADWPIYCPPEGAPYRVFRDKLLARGEALEPFLQSMAAKGQNWQAKTMAAILLERLRKKEEVAALLGSRPTAEYHRAWAIRAPRYVKELTERAAKTPMVLVEAIWKGNELRWEDEEHTRGYAAAALGYLGEQRAVEPLIVLANTAVPPGSDPPWEAKAACAALGCLKDPRAVPVLLRAFALYPDSGTPFEALERCLDRRSLQMVSQAAAWGGNDIKKAVLERLVENKEKEFGMQGPGTPIPKQ